MSGAPPLADRSICRLSVYTDTLAEWVYGYVDLAWLCLRIRRLGGSCLRILSTDTTGIHASPGGRCVECAGKYPELECCKVKGGHFWKVFEFDGWQKSKNPSMALASDAKSYCPDCYMK